MAANFVVESTSQVTRVREIVFAGDQVRLAGQIDYPQHTPISGYFPLLFILQGAGGNARDAYLHYAELALRCGYAVFRWDKRGTGRSGAGGIGSTTQDAVNAFETAIHQSRIDPNRVVILAQGEGSLLLGNAYGLFARQVSINGVVLARNMLDRKAILAINCPVQIVMGAQDWLDWREYAQAAGEAHQAAYPHGAASFVAHNANRRLMVGEGDQARFHSGAQQVMADWLIDRTQAV
jgi:alpha-beta hydrolase superfamily lysophospholipase